MFLAQVPQAAAAAAAVGEDRREKAGAAAASAGAAAARGANGGGGGAGAAVGVARAAVRSSDIPREAKGREQQVPSPGAVETKKAPAVEAAGLKPAGQETAAAAVAKKPTAVKVAEQPPPQQQLLKRGAGAGKKEAAAAAAGTVGVATLEAQMADLQAAEERKQAAKAKKAARYTTPQLGSVFSSLFFSLRVGDSPYPPPPTIFCGVIPPVVPLW